VDDSMQRRDGDWRFYSSN